MIKSGNGGKPKIKRGKAMDKLNKQGKPNRASGDDKWQQQDLLSSGTPLFKTRLHSLTAPRKPFYEIVIYDRPGFGFLIEKFHV